MDIADATFVVTDVETTGTSADDNRVLEIGAVKVRDGDVVDQFQQLVNPQQSVPGRITEMTGITTGMVFEAPPIETVLPEYLEFLGEASKTIPVVMPVISVMRPGTDCWGLTSC